MAKKATPQYGRNRLEEAMAMLIQSEAAFVSRRAEIDHRLAETERASSECFARIEKLLTAILHILSEHSRLLERLPEAVCDKIVYQRQH